MARAKNAEANTAAKRQQQQAAEAVVTGLDNTALAKLVASSPKLTAMALSEHRKTADAERRERLSKPLQRLTRALAAEVKAGALTIADIPYLKIEVDADDSVVVDVKETRSRSGQPTERKSVTSAMLRDHGVTSFERKRGKRVLVADSIAKMLDAAGIAHYFSDKSHIAAGCARDADGKPTCGKSGHGDQAQREILSHLAKLDADGWTIKLANGKSQPIGVMADWTA